VKYEAPIPACLGGDVVGGFPTFIAKTDEERIQNLASEFDSFRGKDFYVSEKIDGTSFTAFANDGEFSVCGRNWQLAEDQTNSHWRVVHLLSLHERLPSLGRSLAVQGELVGPGIQKNRYGLKEPTVFVFNVYDIEASSYLDKSAMEAVSEQLGPQKGRACSIRKLNVRGWSGFMVAATIESRSKRSQTDSLPKAATRE
jgi:RNA ligase (TIGR02306 family)